MSGGVEIRKGTIASWIVDAAVFSAPLDADEKEAARAVLRELALAVVAVDVDKVVVWKDAEVQQILDQARLELARADGSGAQVRSHSAVTRGVRGGETLAKASDGRCVIL